MTMKAISQRHRYLDEKEKIKNEIGDLEQIRTALGLSQRRICQLLLVDPSAWTRWLKTEPPPHIYQALRWLTELRKVNPEAAAPANMANRLDYVQTSTQAKIKKLEESIDLLERSIALTGASQPQVTIDTSGLRDALIAAFQTNLSQFRKKSRTKKITKINKEKFGRKPKASLNKRKKKLKKTNAPRKKLRRKSRKS